MGFFSKLRKKKKNRQGEKKYEEYESVEVGKKQYSQKRAAPELIVADAPKAKYGGKGLSDNTVYQLRDDEEGSHELQEHQKREAAGKDNLADFGDPPGYTTAEEEKRVSSTGKDSAGKDAARAAMDGVADASQPGDNNKLTKNIQDLGSGNAPLGDADSDPVVPPIGERAGIVVNIIVVLKIALAVYLAFLLLFTLWLRPSFYSLFWSVSIGILVGLGYAYLFYGSRYQKRLLNEGFNIQPGRKGMLEMLGQVPSWISFQEKERVTWANLMMGQMWQYYDRAIGQAIKESVEPIMDQYKPPGLVKKIYFKRITFGDLPITIDDIWIENEGEKHILLEASFRLAGNSNIEIAVELAGGATRVVPKVTDLHVSGVARVILSPLLPEVPGFGAMVFSLKRPPLIHFNLSFGSALGGGASASLVKAWLDPFLRDTLTSLLVWPNRIVFPILPESPANNLEDLGVKNVGLIEVTVIKARDLDKEDWLGKSDPLVEVWTQHQHIEATEHKKKTLHPEWNETFYLLVQEPKTQQVRVQVYDWDGIHLKEVLSNINVVKGIKDSFGAKTFMGRCALEIRPFYDEAGKKLEKWLDLGKQEWADEDGTGKGHGSIHLAAQYWPFDLIYSEPRDATIGAVLIHLKNAKDLPAADSNGLSDPYAVLTLGGHSQKSMIVYDTLAPDWQEKFEFIKVSSKEILEIEIWDDDPLDPDDKLGIVEIDISRDVVPQKNCTLEKIFYLRDVPKDDKTQEVKRANVTVKVQWVPFDFNRDRSQDERKHKHLGQIKDHLHRSDK